VKPKQKLTWTKSLSYAVIKKYRRHTDKECKHAMDSAMPMEKRFKENAKIS